jgi:CopG family nickel-responsive transcriptional regulator
MAELAGIGIAISEDLLEQFDRLIEGRGYTNRSEAFRDLIRNELVNDISASADAEVCGAITLIYDHHVRLLLDKLNEVQHQYYRAILSTVHVHLDHDNRLEVILVRGTSALIEKLANSLIATRGVKHGRYILTASGRELP